MRNIFICVLTFGLSTVAIGQVRDRPAAPPAAGVRSDSATIAAGWSAASTKQTEAAVKDAEQILRRRPWDRAALLLKLTALADAAPVRALDAYEQWIGGQHTDDAGLLEPVVIGVVDEIANGRDAELKRSALRALVEARVAGAQAALDALPQTEEARFEREAALGRGGDTGAAQRLINEASAPTGGSPALAAALGEMGPAGEPGLLALLKSTNPQVRAAAAEALGEVGTDASRPPLRALGGDPDPVVRTSATIALAQLGDDTAMTTVERILAGPVPDMQLAAARAWKGRPGPWVAVIKTLLDNPDGLTRIEAARAIAPVDPEAAHRVLEAALADSNPVVRYESAASITAALDRQFAGTGLARLRERLRDRDESVRLAVARVLLRLART